MELAIRIGHDDEAAETGALVQLFAERDTRNQVLPPKLAVGLDDARVVVRVPGVQDRGSPLVVALGDDLALLRLQERAFGNRIAIEYPLRIPGIDDQDAFLALIRCRFVLAGEH